MYSNKQSILQLIALLKAHAITEVVLSPGARNMPIALSLAADRDFRCHSVIDERSAAYFAIGLSLHNRRPVALCCTSGTAALNYAPAVAEAYNQRIPLVIITADRPECLVGQMENQTIPQRSLFGLFVRKSVSLPEIHTPADEWHCNRLINEALLTLNHGCPSPVHINIPLAEPLNNMTVERLPSVRVIDRISHGKDSYVQRYPAYRSAMLILGQGDYPVEGQALEYLARTGCVILAEHLANVADFPGLIRNFDAVLSSIPEGRWKDYTPELLITTGGHILSKHIKAFLRTCRPKAHWHVSEESEVVDPYQCLTTVIESPLYVFLRRVADYADMQPHFAQVWNAASLSIPIPAPAYSDFAAIGEFMSRIPERSILFLGNSMAVRLAHLFPIANRPCSIRCYSNRGVSGIDGNLSTALGIATAATDNNPRPVYIIIGDQSFHYDLNAIDPATFALKNLRILLNNNGGGGIFRTLYGYCPSEVAERYITVRRQSSAKEWAQERGLHYLPVRNEEELKENISPFVDQSTPASILMEVFTDMDQNAIETEKYQQLLRQ